MATDFRLFRYTNIVICALSLIGMNLLVGYNGQILLGHGAFCAFGADATAMKVLHAGVPYWLAVLLAGAMCLVAGALFDLPLLKLAPVHLRGREDDSHGARRIARRLALCRSPQTLPCREAGRHERLPAGLVNSRPSLTAVTRSAEGLHSISSSRGSPVDGLSVANVRFVPIIALSPRRPQ